MHVMLKLRVITAQAQRCEQVPPKATRLSLFRTTRRGQAAPAAAARCTFGAKPRGPNEHTLSSDAVKAAARVSL